MKIGIDGRSLNTNRAIFRYTKNLLNSLAQIDRENEYFLFMEGGQNLDKVSFLNLSVNWRLVKAPRKIVLKDHFLFERFMRGFNLDVFFHPDNTEFLHCHPRSIVAIHDLIPYLLPKLCLSTNWLVRKRQELYLAMQKRAVLTSARHIITMSQNSQSDLINVFGLEKEMVSVTHEAVEDSYRPVPKKEAYDAASKYGVSGEYIFCHAGFSPYKNILGLVSAFCGFSRYNPAVSLVLGGAYKKGDSYLKIITTLIKKQGLSERVVFTGYIPEENLPAVYSGATAFVYPSFYEGFGIPPLEAQACGVPVLCSNNSSLPEVVGDAALLFDPRSPEEMTEKLARVCNDAGLRNKLIELGFNNVKRFSWVRCARETLEIFNKIHREA